MKRNHLLVLFAMIGLQSVAAGNAIADASPFPADAEMTQTVPALDTFADRHARMGSNPEAWGVSKREAAYSNPFPSGGGYIDD